MLVWLRMWASIPFHTQDFKPLQNSSWLFSNIWVSPACKHPSCLTLHGYSVRSRLTLTSLLAVDFSQTSSPLSPSQNISPNRETGARNSLLRSLMLLAKNCISRGSQLKCPIKPRATFSQQSRLEESKASLANMVLSFSPRPHLFSPPPHLHRTPMAHSLKMVSLSH